MLRINFINSMLLTRHPIVYQALRFCIFFQILLISYIWLFLQLNGYLRVNEARHICKRQHILFEDDRSICLDPQSFQDSLFPQAVNIFLFQLNVGLRNKCFMLTPRFMILFVCVLLLFSATKIHNPSARLCQKPNWVGRMAKEQ